MNAITYYCRFIPADTLLVSDAFYAEEPSLTLEINTHDEDDTLGVRLNIPQLIRLRDQINEFVDDHGILGEDRLWTEMPA